MKLTLQSLDSSSFPSTTTNWLRCWVCQSPEDQHGKMPHRVWFPTPSRALHGILRQRPSARA
jgi:hypothetical protein